ncbi:MAG: hypothetical protein J6P82_00975, partial [Bacteroidales bacterium]|nr:hypothetical protein [Bacteroidales bacterium]
IAKKLHFCLVNIQILRIFAAAISELLGKLILFAIKGYFQFGKLSLFVINEYFLFGKLILFVMNGFFPF